MSCRPVVCMEGGLKTLECAKTSAMATRRSFPTPHQIGLALALTFGFGRRSHFHAYQKNAHEPF